MRYVIPFVGGVLFAIICPLTVAIVRGRVADWHRERRMIERG